MKMGWFLFVVDIVVTDLFIHMFLDMNSKNKTFSEDLFYFQINLGKYF